ncbi:UNVERIFIED_CONTAM: Glycylpeptide N-tetradecanoyltransferase 1 [Sesamum angustifolium]|uniref:Glycylpeptide N-tetradecanoyltransferase n=1 Tax=Sesamum angustifolium TaxID=2727405 RepID=A0AAW2RKJ8_9LAMI
MADDNAPSENHINSGDNTVPSENENEISIDALAKKVQESLSLAKRHKFWETQPVGQFKDLGDTSLPEGPIEPPTPVSEVKQEPYNLPAPYEWITCDIDSEEVCSEVYSLLTNNYVEDDENMFRFNYSKEFLRWALRPPGYYRSWHIGVRVKSSKKLVAFITGVPARIRVRDAVVLMAEVNFLCVHKKLRSKRLAPVMIKEVTRRVHLENIWQAAYTAGVVLPTPITTCQYWHRSLNPKKLIDVGFSRLGARMTMSRTIKLYKLPDQTATPDSERWNLMMFLHFYTLPSSILGSQTHSILKAASYYNVSTKTPLLQLMNDALIVAKKKDFDVFNALMSCIMKPS